MPDMKYEAELVILPWTADDGRPFEKASVPVKSFSVDGGANRTIDLKSTDDVSVASELEQARTHENLTVFIPPTNDFRAVKLVQLYPAGGPGKIFSFTFVVCVYVKGRKV